MELSLLFNFKGVTQTEWDAAWKDCYHILEQFPVPLGTISDEEKWDCKRLVISSKILSEEGTKDELLEFRLDMVSLEWGGVYKLYRNLSHYAEFKCDHDILWDNTEEAKGYMGEEFNIDHVVGSPLDIWGNGTGGAPYTLAVLALGILLENRFPDNCFLWGEYSDEQVEKMRIWLSALLQENINTPVCNDLERLFERLITLYDTPDLVVRRFWALSKSRRRETFQFLCEHGYDAALQDEIIRRVKCYSSVDQWGVTDLLYPYLEASQDIEHLIELVQKVHTINHQEEFSLEILLKSLVNKGITVNPYQNDSETVKEWNNLDKTLTTPMQDLNMTILRMSGLPSRIDFYISADKLIEIFGCTEPANGKKFQEIIEQGTEKTKEDYRKLAEVTEQLEEKMSRTMPDSSTSYFQTKAALIRRRYLPSEDYILCEVENQSNVFPAYKAVSIKFAEIMGENVVHIFKNEPEKFTYPSLAGAKKHLTRLISDKFNLRDTGWQAIDDETDMDILKMLIAYAAHPQREIHFWDFRKFVFETPELWADMRNSFLEHLVVVA
ncbi:hypothetical protein FACS189430_02850 [Bacteroidia bacterium]|nr:hypothetical protein FACS189430_02850 [Bacteroidia bacterium]